MRSRLPAIALVLSALIVGAAFVDAARAAGTDSLRCGGKVAQGGESRESVRNKCGEPSGVTHQVLYRRAGAFYTNNLYLTSDEIVEVQVEIWTYNFGPNKLMHLLKFVDGILETVETLGYGYRENG